MHRLPARAVVLQHGAVALAGAAAELAANPTLLRAYLGARREPAPVKGR